MITDILNTQKARDLAAAFLLQVENGETQVEVEFNKALSFRLVLSDGSRVDKEGNAKLNFKAQLIIPVDLGNGFLCCPVCYAEDIYIKAAEVLMELEKQRQVA